MMALPASLGFSGGGAGHASLDRENFAAAVNCGSLGVLCALPIVLKPAREQKRPATPAQPGECMADRALVAGLWIVLAACLAAAIHFGVTALAAPDRASARDHYHRDFGRLKILYYFAVWAGTGVLVFFGVRAMLRAVPLSVGVAITGWDHICDALAIGLAFASILFVHQLSVVREYVTAQNLRRREAETLRENVQKLIEELDFMDGAAAHEIRAFFYHCKIDIEAKGSGLTVQDRELLRGILDLARRGIPEMEGVERPGLQ